MYKHNFEGPFLQQESRKHRGNNMLDYLNIMLNIFLISKKK
jgi:hypothetical protein